MVDFHIHNVDRTLISDMIDARSIDHMNLMKLREGKVRRSCSQTGGRR